MTKLTLRIDRANGFEDTYRRDIRLIKEYSAPDSREHIPAGDYSVIIIEMPSESAPIFANRIAEVGGVVDGAEVK